jgi:D-beta-D-heptose 7-phosphate kinase/D-beta-D-heptose 1-phosphate adenosyltransferase
MKSEFSRTAKRGEDSPSLSSGAPSAVQLLDRNRVKELVGSFSATRVLMIGDVILDEYRWGTALGLSAETPTIVARDDTTSVSIGGAGLYCRNMLALGGNVKFISLIGGDEFNRFAKQFRHKNLAKLFIEDKSRKTTVKSRFWVSGYKLLQWDQLDNRFIDPSIEAQIVATIRAELGSFDRLIVSDYRHGLLTETLAAELVSIAREFGKPIYVDSQVSQRAGNHRWYTGANLFCVNEREAKTVDAEFDNRPIGEAIGVLREMLRADAVVVKLGEKGCATLIDGELVTVAPPATVVRDTSGAGDAFFAVLSLAPGNLTREHLAMANTWAALSTTLKGAQPPTLAMLDEVFRKPRS